MALSAKLEMRQSQSLVMTPQLQQAIKLLQLSNIELNDYVDAELERNPLLERKPDESAGDMGDGQAGPGQNGPETGGDGGGEPAAAADIVSEMRADAPSSEKIGDLDTDFDNIYPETGALPSQQQDLAGWNSVGAGGGRGFEGEDHNLEAYVAEQISLRDHLTAQLHTGIADPSMRMIGQYLIDLVDEGGYVRGDLEELAAQLGASPELVDDTLAVMQNFEPTGVFARDLAECLALQLDELGELTEHMQLILDNLQLLAAHDFAKLKRILKVEDDHLRELIAEIRSLDPKPGLQFQSELAQAVAPDVFVTLQNGGGWRVELNSETLPRILVNRSYYATVSRGVQSAEDKTYLSDCLQTANWLTKSLDQRARTILRVSEEIVRQQDGFFAYGVEHLRPLNLKTVAEAIEMHESTVSRVTSNKFMATSRGVFELKYFFTSSIPGAEDGATHSSEAVRYKIKQLIDAEAPDKVLSDDKIVSLLKDEGIDIARRTVAKYREALRIPSSVQRRREKKMLLREKA